MDKPSETEIEWDRRSAERRQLDQLSAEVNALKSEVHVLKVGQSHLSELFAAKLNNLDTTVKLSITKIENLGDKFNGLISEPNQSPMGRVLLEKSAENHRYVTDLEKEVNRLTEWKSNWEGGIWFLRLLTIPGIIAFFVWLAGFLKTLGG